MTELSAVNLRIPRLTRLTRLRFHKSRNAPLPVTAPLPFDPYRPQWPTGRLVFLAFEGASILCAFGGPETQSRLRHDIDRLARLKVPTQTGLSLGFD